MQLLKIYSCLNDATRLRILRLLDAGPLCVCHFQELLNEPQVKISKHLNYLKRHGLVSARREANWMIYSLPKKQTKELRANLACLHICVSEDPLFKKDADRLRRLKTKFSETSPICCVRVTGVKRKKGLAA